MKKDIKTAILWLVITCIWAWVLNRMSPGTPFQAFFCSLIVLTPMTMLMILAIRALIWRAQNGVNLFVTLETDREVLKRKLLLRMRDSTPYTFSAIANDIIEESHNYPQWDIIGSRMFQSWYKYNIDYMLQRPSHFDMSTFDGGYPYIKENDLDYNINADPWKETDWENIEFEDTGI